MIDNVRRTLFMFAPPIDSRWLKAKRQRSTAIDRSWLRLVRSHIRFCETDEPEKSLSPLRIAYFTTESAGEGTWRPPQMPDRPAGRGWVGRMEPCCSSAAAALCDLRGR